jgi:hypothetical protein
MNDHLQIKPGHILTGAAGAGGVMDHLPQGIGKNKIQVFERIQNGLRFTDIGFRNVHEDRIAAKAGDHKRMFDMGKLYVKQVLKRILGVIQFGFGQEFGVPRNIGKDEITSFCHANSKYPRNGFAKILSYRHGVRMEAAEHFLMQMFSSYK